MFGTQIIVGIICIDHCNDDQNQLCVIDTINWNSFREVTLGQGDYRSHSMFKILILDNSRISAMGLDSGYWINFN